MGKKKLPIETPVADVSIGDNLLEMATKIVAAYVANNQVPAKEVPDIFKSVYNALKEIAGGAPTVDTERKPAVPVKKSVTDKFLICLEDGKELTMLKRYLRTHFNMSPEEYRKKWGLPHDYPMVAPAYARLRSAFAKKAGLGTVPIKRKPKKAPE